MSTATKRTPTEKAVWVHPDANETAAAFMARIGVGIGDDFLVAHCVSWEMPPEVTSRSKGDGLWRRGRAVVHHFTRHTYVGPASYPHMVKIAEHMAISVINPGLRTGGIIGDPVLCFPIAKATA